MNTRMLLMSLSVLTIFFSCGKETTKTTASGATDISSTSGALSVVPSATGEVVSGSLTAALSGYDELASTGTVLSQADQNTFTSGDSTAMCETANLLKNVLRESAQADKILCYIKAMASSGIIPSNFADGEFHYLKLVNLPGGGGSNDTPSVKMKILVTDGRVADFKLFSCFNGSTASPSQSEYISQTNDGSTAAMVSKYNGSESGNSFGASVSVDGTLNSDGEWTSKTLEGTNYFNDGSSGSYNMNVSMTQGADSITLSGYRKGSFTFGASTQTFQDSFYTVAQILGASSLATFALGDGSSKVNISFNDGSTTHNLNTTESWTGDDGVRLADATTGDFYSTANSGTTPTVPSSVSAISLTGDEVWDCSLPSGESFTEANFSAGGSALENAMNSCETTFSPGQDWIECSQTY